MLFSCSSSLDKKFNADTSLEDIQALKGKIDSTDLKLLSGSMFRLQFQDKKLEEMTYGEILENCKTWKAEQENIEAEQKALAAKAAKDEAERIKKLNKAVLVSCFEKGSFRLIIRNR